MYENEAEWKARIPADMDRPEPLVWGLTARQILLLAPAAGAAWVIARFGLAHVPSWTVFGFAGLLLAFAYVVAVGHRDGVSLDRYAALGTAWAVNHLRRGHAPPPGLGTGDDGTCVVGDRRLVVLECGTVPFQLAAAQEKVMLLGAFAGFLDSLHDPVQIVVQRDRMDLAPHIDRLSSHAVKLSDPRLRRAARTHAAFLSGVQSEHELTRHRVLLVLSSPARAGSPGFLLRRGEDAVDQLAAVGVRARICDPDEVRATFEESSLAPDPEREPSREAT